MKLLRLLVLAALCTAPGTAFAVTISNAGQLAAALRTARGGEVFDLAPGNYGALNLYSRRFSVPITFRSSNASRPAVFGRTQINGTAGVRFDNVEFSNPLSAGQPSWTAAVRLNGSSAITFNNVSIHGSLDRNAGNDGYGIHSRSSSNVTISNSRFTQLYRAVLVESNQNVSLTGNVVRDIRSEGFNFAATQGVRVIGNSFSEFHPLGGDHPDAVQFWTAGTNRPSSNILVSNNLIVGAAGGRMQGIFITGSGGALRYQNVTIANNTIIGTMWHGIAIMGATGVSVTGNKVVTVPDNVFKTAWILLNDAQGVLSGNDAKQFVITNSPGLRSTNNTPNTISAALAQSLIDAWNATHKLPLPTPAPSPGTGIVKTAKAAFSIATPTPDTDVPVADKLFQSDPLKTAAIPDTSGTSFDQAGVLERNLADGGVPVDGNLVSAVPEPATWVQLLLGFGTVGWVIRRSRSRQTATA